MPKTPRRTIVRDGKKVEVIEPEDVESELVGPPPNPSWKKLKADLILEDLKVVTQLFKDELNLVRNDIPPAARSTIRWYLQCVDEILTSYENYHSVDVPPGRPRKQAERLIAKEVVIEFQELNNDAKQFPTGNYLYDRMTIINEERLASGRTKLLFSNKGCDNWISEMKKGKFDPASNDFFDFLDHCESFDRSQ
jgi:hypothetical protein